MAQTAKKRKQSLALNQFIKFRDKELTALYKEIGRLRHELSRVVIQTDDYASVIAEKALHKGKKLTKPKPCPCGRITKLDCAGECVEVQND